MDFYSQFVTFEKIQGSQAYAVCPFHAETIPSFTVNTDTNQWYCHSCGQGGSEVQFLMLYYDVTRDVAENVFSYWNKRKKLPFPTEEWITGCQELLKKKTYDLELLCSFGMTPEVIEKYRLGIDDNRIVFPIPSKTDKWVNARKYLPPYRQVTEERKLAKVLNIAGLGSCRFYPYEAFDKDEIFLVEGEKDALVAISQGLNAVTGTGGSNIPTHELNLFTGKTVYIMTDSDRAGQKLAQDYARLLSSICRSVQRILLPEKDFTDFHKKYPNGDVLEYTTDISVQSICGTKDEITPVVSLGMSEKAEKLNTFMLLENMSVTGVDPKIYTIPCKLRALCKSITCKKTCSVGTAQEPMVIDVEPRNLLQFIDSGDGVQHEYLREIFGCRSIIAEPVEYINAQKVLFQESAEFIDGVEETTFEPRYGVYLYTQKRLIPTLKYNFNACRVTAPRNQQSYYVISEATQSDDKHDELLNSTVLFFQHMAGRATGAIELLDMHYRSWLPKLGITGRVDLFGALLLTCLSVTEIPWKGGIIKGWLDSMVIGDTRTGKSQMTQRFIKTLEKGAYINGENSKKTGIIGGIQQFGSSWVITWGAIPMNDMGLLVIDEASGMSIEDIKEMSSVRSSGAVTINKIVKGEAKARTRLLWLSNPRSGKNIEDFYWKGFGAFREYIPVAEDEARYDLVLTAAHEDVQQIEDVQYDSSFLDLRKYKQLVDFAWSVSVDNVSVEKQTERLIADSAAKLTQDYGGGPLVVGVAVYEKVLRLSAAFAVLCGSIANQKRVVITNTHIQYAEEFLRYIFDKPSMDYKGYVQEVQRAQKKKAENTQYIRMLCKMHPALRILLSSNSFKGIQVREILGLDQLEASKIVSDLLQRGLLRVHGNGSYTPDKLLIDMAKQMEVDI